ncbi:hypothetical protein E2562_000449 [Oryza meyeriana var. granulata]|uniref:Uncharacterized protein n=1 Tax=Oryza meyeriana var. granulata TaxID=110450 RepID=A0A6G1CC80_9ORYZ|nr:hypothetical protein E2562_000449 [Oryza meyeriana var. granulata]
MAFPCKPSSGGRPINPDGLPIGQAVQKNAPPIKNHQVTSSPSLLMNHSVDPRTEAAMDSESDHGDPEKQHHKEDEGESWPGGAGYGDRG